MSLLRLAYLGLAAGLVVYGAILLWLGFRRPSRPAGTLLRLVMGLAVLVALAGTAAAVILEARASQPW
ncbi:MAG: hypothetical protein HY002_10225 [Candidatus Rokubacteria bacterium]|nr:hypothetical protein [Candidatus Rokubacteria bacterium]